MTATATRRRIRILVEGLAFAIPTALVALTAVDGLVLADCLNRALGLDRVACGAALRGGSAALPPHRSRTWPFTIAWHVRLTVSTSPATMLAT